jgi:DnaJ-class molecular chaperone
MCHTCNGTGGLSAQHELGTCVDWDLGDHGDHRDDCEPGDCEPGSSEGSTSPEGSTSSEGSRNSTGADAPSSASSTACVTRALPQTLRRTCPTCRGYGTLPDVTCPHCQVT